MAIPKILAIAYDMTIAADTVTIGIAILLRPVAYPFIIVVAGPVSAAFAIARNGLYSAEVNNCVLKVIRIVAQ